MAPGPCIAADRWAKLRTHGPPPPVKERARGVSPGELLTCIAEAQLAGAECVADLEDIRADETGAPLRALREHGATFTVSVPRSSAMWVALERIEEGEWEPAAEMQGAEVAETTYAPQDWKAEPLRLIVRRVALRAADVSPHTRSRRRPTIHPDQLALLEAGEDAGRLYGYSFILTDRDEDGVWVEHHHRHRAQIEERIREAKLGAALRRLPSGDLNANRLWAFCACRRASAMRAPSPPPTGRSGRFRLPDRALAPRSTRPPLPGPFRHARKRVADRHIAFDVAVSVLRPAPKVSAHSSNRRFHSNPALLTDLSQIEFYA